MEFTKKNEPGSPTGVAEFHNNKFNNTNGNNKKISIEDLADELIKNIEKFQKEEIDKCENKDDECLLINEYLKNIIIIINVNRNICSAEKVRVKGINNKLITENDLKIGCKEFVKMMGELNNIILLQNNNEILEQLKGLVVEYKYNFFFEKKNIVIGSKVKAKEHRPNNEGTIIAELYNIKYDNGSTEYINSNLIKPEYELKFKGGKNKTKKQVKNKSKRKQIKKQTKKKNKTKKVKKTNRKNSRYIKRK